jgi:DNA-binding MarR family transcriptional regulator
MNSNKQVSREELFGLVNGKLPMRINRYLGARFRAAGIGITVEQWTVLACLWQQDKVSQQSLVQTTYRDKTSVTRLIDNLEKQGFVVRVSDMADRRANVVYLTQQGIDLEQKATAVVEEVVERTLRILTEEEVSMGKALLKKVFDNLA